MSDSTKSAHPEDAPTAARECVDGLLAGAPHGPSGQASPSVRELLAELAQLEDSTRGLGGVPRPRWTTQSTDFLAALAREQEIIDELHRRCPDAQLATRSTADGNGAVERAD